METNITKRKRVGNVKLSKRYVGDKKRSPYGGRNARVAGAKVALEGEEGRENTEPQGMARRAIM